MITPNISKYEPAIKQAPNIGNKDATEYALFSADIPPMVNVAKEKNKTVLIYAGPGNFAINLDFCKELNRTLREAEIPAYYIMQKTYPKAVISMALNDGIETLISICTSRNNSVPALNGQELYSTSRKSYLLSTSISEALASSNLIRTFPRLEKEPANSPSWTAAKHGLTLTRINLGYLSNYYDADLIINHGEELAKVISEGISGYEW
ncbi:hypothetical protein IJ096_01585 [Candidatus Saccharibacteria bacterium]|nr:hypothetical protein [Candidatus Saccharibacteria bacterium]